MQIKPAQVATSGLFEPHLTISLSGSSHRLIASAVSEVASAETGIDCLYVMAPQCSTVIESNVCVCVLQCWSDGT